MKLIHCADLHLDSRMTSNLTREKADQRKNELLAAFSRMIDYGVENQVDAIVIAGDLYDTRRISAAAKNTVLQAILNHPSIRFYYLRGNHDADSFLGGLEQIPANLCLFGEQWTTYELGNISITGAELNRDNGETIWSSLFLQRDKFNLVVLHGQDTPYGGKNDAQVINLKELKNKGIDYLALGHIHTYREGELDSRGVYCYPGCLEGRGFDECGDHGFVLLEIDEQRRTCRREFIPMASRCLYIVDTDITDCMTTAEIAGRVEAALEKAALSPRSLVKVVLRGEVDVECEKEPGLLARQFEPDYYFLKVEDESRLKVDYTSYALDESLKGEFVRTVMGEEAIDGEDKAAIIRYGMQALAGEEIR